MTRPFASKEKRFSIDDAFEEETDEAIKVYGATGDRSPLQTKYKNGAEYLSSDWAILVVHKSRKVYKLYDVNTHRRGG
ncbi:hypothetical protein EVAR_86248_1 [Eumeta japonica]|uniref:Uncharacterized protein n=1 Tax=Eumeta variegata TaxID=151549 RepID=A0A4C1UBR5_EUMVA|nr:hypothetical protein EVAR_86248_1 [Eumeta japonica]